MWVAEDAGYLKPESGRDERDASAVLRLPEQGASY